METMAPDWRMASHTPGFCSPSRISVAAAFACAPHGKRLHSVQDMFTSTRAPHRLTSPRACSVLCSSASWQQCRAALCNAMLHRACRFSNTPSTALACADVATQRQRGSASRSRRTCQPAGWPGCGRHQRAVGCCGMRSSLPAPVAATRAAAPWPAVTRHTLWARHKHRLPGALRKGMTL